MIVSDMDQSPNLLTCIALSPRAPGVVRDALRVAGLLKLRPIFLHVGEAGGDRQQKVTEIIRQAWGEPSQEIGADQLLFRMGQPANVITSAAAEIGARVIILGALDRDPPMTRIWGSVARQVARTAPCSVMLLPDPGDRPDVLRRIVVGIKLDAESAAMVKLALRLAGGSKQSTVHFVHEFSVVEARWANSGVPGRAGASSSIEEYILQRRQEDEQMLRDYLCAFDTGDTDIRTASLAGHEGMEIVAYAREHHADLLVQPTPYRRLNIWDRFFHHPAELAMRQLPCGLLLYREPALSSRRAYR
jgi:nucleotide-binding universal stress UspA family protein